MLCPGNEHRGNIVEKIARRELTTPDVVTRGLGALSMTVGPQTLRGTHCIAIESPLGDNDSGLHMAALGEVLKLVVGEERVSYTDPDDLGDSVQGSQIDTHVLDAEVPASTVYEIEKLMPTYSSGRLVHDPRPDMAQAA